MYTAMQSQKAVAADFSKNQLLSFGFVEYYTAIQSQNTITAYLKSNQLYFGFARIVLY